METKFYQETTRKRSHLKEGAEKMQEQTQIGDKMKFDLDIGESEMLEVTAVVREKFPHVVYMEYKGRGGNVRKSTWERFESKLNEEQREIVHLIGRFNAFYGIEEPNTKTLYHGAWILLQGRRTRCSIHMEK